MVLVAGQYDAGGLGRASLQDCAADVSKLSFGGSAGENAWVIASTTAVTESWVTGHSPVVSCVSATGSSPRRSSISFLSIFAHADAPSVNPIWKAEIRSNAEPCSSKPGSDALSDWIGSRNEIIVARTLLSPSPVLTVKRGDLPSATQRMYTPAKQSACCSETKDGVADPASWARR